MVVQLLFALLVLATGAAVNRVLRLPASVALFSGLATLIVLTRWCVALGAPPMPAVG